MASNRHGKVTRKAYRVIFSGMQVSDKTVKELHFSRFYRNPITEPEARKEAANDPDIKNDHIYGITVLSIRECILGMDWHCYVDNSHVLEWDPVDH